MKPDLYTKGVLTVIALMLTVIACKTVTSPETTASAQGQFAGVQWLYDGGTYIAFDNRTGELWKYFAETVGPCPVPGGGFCSASFTARAMGKMSKVGEPILLAPPRPTQPH